MPGMDVDDDQPEANKPTWVDRKNPKQLNFLDAKKRFISCILHEKYKMEVLLFTNKLNLASKNTKKNWRVKKSNQI